MNLNTLEIIKNKDQYRIEVWIEYKLCLWISMELYSRPDGNDVLKQHIMNYIYNIRGYQE